VNPLLQQAAPAAAGAVALDQLEAAAKAMRGLGDRDHPEALHDLRVAVRRLRSTLRAYSPWLGRAASKKVQRRLRDLAHTTGAGRDAEVQIEWLSAQRASLRRSERTGLNWLLTRLRRARRAGYVEARVAAERRFEHVAVMLRDRLRAPDAPLPAFAQAVGTAVATEADEVKARLRAIASADDVDAVHEARIHGKRLRYLLEPLAEELPEAAAMVPDLKRLQDLLGELHDAHVLDATLATELEKASADKAHRLHDLAAHRAPEADVARARRRDERIGIVALVRSNAQRRDDLFARLRDDWLGGEAARLVEAASRLGKALAPPVAFVGPSPPCEIERKYLLSALPPAARSAPVATIEQGWLPGNQLRERLRRVTSKDGVRRLRTVKWGSGIQRVEIEEETTPELFAALWPLTAGCRVSKHRYHVRADGDGTVWEVDEFTDRALVLAEVELAETDQRVEVPAWLAPYVVREVTHEPEYVNLNLAR